MIVVFCEWGGQLLLGKAREIADELGERVVAFCSTVDSALPQKLIYLGADEVVVCPVTSVGDWVSVIVKHLGKLRGLKMIIFPSGLLPNALMGTIFGSMKEGTGPFMEDAEVLTSNGAAKKLQNLVMLHKQFSLEKIALISLKKTSVVEPFEDTSRSGKIRNLESGDFDKSELVLPSEFQPSSDKLVILVGRGVDDTTLHLVNRISDKYDGAMEALSGKIEVVYGPCVAIEVASKLRDLPDFKGEVISISSKRLPINSVAELSAITPDVNTVLESLIT